MGFLLFPTLPQPCTHIIRQNHELIGVFPNLSTRTAHGRMAVYFLARASQSCEVEFTRWLMPRLRDPPHGSGVRVARIELLFQLHLIPASSHLLPDLRLSTRSIALLTRPTPVLSLSKMQPSREPSWVGLASSSSYCLLSYRNRGLQWVFHSPQSHSLWCSAPSPPARYSRRRRFQLEQEWRWEGQGWSWVEGLTQL